MKKYTKDWTSDNFKVWFPILQHLRDRPATYLEIGSYEGRSTVWMAENIFTHPESKMLCIDPWDLEENVYKSNNDMLSVKENFINNTSEFREKIVAFEGYSFDVLCTLNAHPPEQKSSFDVIYVDGDHRTLPVLQDCVLAWGLLPVGGVMIFDDVGSGDDTTPVDSLPKIAVDSFLTAIHGKYRSLYFGYQTIIQRTK